MKFLRKIVVPSFNIKFILVFFFCFVFHTYFLTSSFAIDKYVFLLHEKNHDWFNLGIYQTLLYRIENCKDLYLYPETTYTEAITNQIIQNIWNNNNSAAAIQKIKNSLDVNYVIIGEYSKTSGFFIARIKLINLKKQSATVHRRDAYATRTKNITIKEKGNDLVGFQKKIVRKIISSNGTAKKQCEAEVLKQVSFVSMESFMYFSKGMIYMKQKRIDEGLKNFTIALQIVPDYRDAHFYLGKYYALERFLYSDAQMHFTKIIKKNFNDPKTHLWLGFIYYLQGPTNYEDAVKEFNIAKEQNPFDIDVYAYLGVLFNDIGDYEKVISNYKKAVELNPQNAVLWYHLSCVYALKNMHSEALAALRKTFEIDNSFWKTAGDDADLNNIRNDNKFKGLMEEFRLYDR